MFELAINVLTYLEISDVTKYLIIGINTSNMIIGTSGSCLRRKMLIEKNDLVAEYPDVDGAVSIIVGK